MPQALFASFILTGELYEGSMLPVRYFRHGDDGLTIAERTDTADRLQRNLFVCDALRPFIQAEIP
jgi:hypothetical protein